MITIVTGPPCGGKSTFIDQNAKDGDIVIDMDEIAKSLVKGNVNNHDYSEEVRSIAMAARKAAVKQGIIIGQGNRLGIWIIHTNPPVSERHMYQVIGAKIIECSPGLQICLERLKNRPTHNKAKVESYIRDYYAIRQ
jgi:predicted ABC-type ATPase